MKTMRKVFALLMALSMILALAISANAEGETSSDTSAAPTGTIKITPPTDTAADAHNEYKIYKIFDAVANGNNITYKVIDGVGMPLVSTFISDDYGNVYHYSGTAADATTEGAIGITKNRATMYIVPTGGELTQAEITALQTLVKEKNIALADTATSKGTADATSKALPYGYYFIATNTGTAVTVDSVNGEVPVQDKNEVPTLTKEKDGGAEDIIAQVGTPVPYKITVNAKKGAKGYIVDDSMVGLAIYTAPTVKVGDAVVSASESTYTYEAKANNVGFTITFNDAYIAGLVEATGAATIEITYNATITSDALTVDPATNTASLKYGDPNDQKSTPDSGSDNQIYNATVQVTKTDSTGAALPGAGFVLMKDGKYYQAGTDQTNNNKVINWVDKVENATVLTTTEQSNVLTFAGLGEGTYTLHEQVVPTGYNQAADETFTVAASDLTPKEGETTNNINLLKATTVVNQQGVELPSTGGIGTTIFTVVGATLMIGAAVLFITKKRSTN
jgi:fimbrial isopeptide formation D2 family protein/LPXTG-motif cell wall-anchored protein